MVDWETRRDLTRRPLERAAYCRGCDDEMSKGTEVIATYSWRNRGQHIYFCLTCSATIGKLAE